MKRILFLTLAFLIATTSVTNFSYAALVIPSSSALPLSNEPDPATSKSAISEFKNLSKKERKSRIKEAKKEMKAYQAAKKAGDDPSTNTLLLVILAILLPPLAVYLHQGETNNKFWITTILFVLGIIGTFLFSGLLLLASIVYALIVILGNG